MATRYGKFRKTDNTGFNYIYEDTIAAGDTVLLRFPVVTANKRGVNEIDWQIDGGATLYATLSDKIGSDSAIWQVINTNEDINKCAAGLKIVGVSSESNVLIRIILY